MLSFEDVSKSYVRLLQITGLLPFPSKNSNSLGTRILFGYFYFMNICFWFPFVCYFFNESERHIDTICETILILSLSIRYNLFVWKRKRIESLLEEIEEIWLMCTQEGRQIVSTFAQRMHRVQNFYLCIIVTANILYPINALIIRLPPLEPNGTERRSLPYKWYSENAEDMWPGYWWTFGIQFVVVQTSVAHFFLCGTVLGGFIMTITGYFSYLRYQLLSTIEATDLNGFSWHFELVRLIKFHQKLLLLSDKLERIASTIFLVQVSTTCYNVSLIGFKLSSSDPDRSKYISIFLGSICQLFMCQWPPDCLYDESKEVGQAAYAVSTTWMKHRECGKFLVLMILRAQRPVRMTAGGFVPLSLETFGSMMTSAYQFFTMLRRFDL